MNIISAKGDIESHRFVHVCIIVFTQMKYLNVNGVIIPSQ